MLGSPVAGNKADGRLWSARYTSYGEKMLNPAANDNHASFTGHIDDSATGLTYMQARYYDPNIGRFLSIDPVEFSVGSPAMFGRYTYCYNDPINCTDPDGEVGLFGAVLGAISGGVGAYIASGGDLKATVKGVVMGGTLGSVLGAAGGRIGASVATRAGMSVPGQLSTTLNAGGQTLRNGMAGGLSSGGGSAAGQVVGGTEKGESFTQAVANIDPVVVLGATAGGVFGGFMNTTHAGSTAGMQVIGAIDDGMYAGAGELAGEKMSEFSDEWDELSDMLVGSSEEDLTYHSDYYD